MADLIRDASQPDAAAIVEIYAPYVENTSISFESIAPDAHEMAQRIETIQATHPFLVAVQGGVISGYAYATPYRSRHAYRHTAEVSVYTRAAGIATALYDALFARLKIQEIHLLIAVITLPNDRSVAFHEKHGFSHVGTLTHVGRKFDRWHDTAIYQKQL